MKSVCASLARAAGARRDLIARARALDATSS
jgi:hypothetical protein